MPGTSAKSASCTNTIQYPSAILDGEGKLIGGYRPNERVAPASTTKVWTYYTLLLMEKERHLPFSMPTEPLSEREKAAANRKVNEAERGKDVDFTVAEDVYLMLEHSDNAAAVRLAMRAMAKKEDGWKFDRKGMLEFDEADAKFLVKLEDGKNYSIPLLGNLQGEKAYKKYNALVGAFVEQMNAYAQAEGLKETRFSNPNGMPRGDSHYSTPYEMAQWAYIFYRDFADHKENVRMGDPVRTMGSNREPLLEFGKTGTGGDGINSPVGSSSYIGGERTPIGGTGFYAIASVKDPAGNVDRQHDTIDEFIRLAGAIVKGISRNDDLICDPESRIAAQSPFSGTPLPPPPVTRATSPANPPRAGNSPQ